MVIFRTWWSIWLLAACERLLWPAELPECRSARSLWCSIYNNITQLDIPTRRRQVATETPDSAADQQAPLPQPDNGVPVYVMLPLDTVWLLERDGRKFSVSLTNLV